MVSSHGSKPGSLQLLYVNHLRLQHFSSCKLWAWGNRPHCPLHCAEIIYMTMRPACIPAHARRPGARPELPLLRRPTSKPRAAQKTSVLDDRLDRHPAADIAQLECRHMRGGGRSGGAGTTRRRLRGEALGHAAGELQRHGIAADIVVLQLEANGALPTDADQQLRPDDLCELGRQSATPLQFPA
jgi:hypothetical protein